MNQSWLSWKRDLCVAGAGALVAAAFLVPGGVYHLHAAQEQMARLEEEANDLRIENKLLRTMSPIKPMLSEVTVQ
jgi:high-affinity Fe2+/Pb2+ permease